MSDRDGLIEMVADPECSSDIVPPLREGLSPVSETLPDFDSENEMLSDDDWVKELVEVQSLENVPEREF